jgi:hypothetical protein
MFPDWTMVSLGKGDGNGGVKALWGMASFTH